MILTEFFDSNTHRCYPFADVNELPTDLIVDIQFIVTNNVNKESISIHKITVAENLIQFYVQASVEGITVDLGLLATVSTAVDPYSEHAFTLVNDEHKVIMQGSITVGYFDTVLRQNKELVNDIPVAVFDLQDSGLILPQRVVPVTEWCTGLIVNDVLYTGNVTLSVGEGLELEEDEEGNLVISARKLTTPTAETMTDEALIEEILRRLGTNVTSINGLTGDVTIGTGSYRMGRNLGSGSDANNIHVKTNGQAVIISNSIDDPNYDINGGSGVVDTSTINTLLANATALNERAGTIEQHNYAMDNAVNLLGAQLAKVD